LHHFILRGLDKPGSSATVSNDGENISCASVSSTDEQQFFYIPVAIVAGSVDAGATWDFNWSQAMQKHQDVFKALWTSPPIPNVGIAVHPAVPEAMQKKVQDALLRIDPRLLQGLSPLGYVAKPDSFYEVIRQLEAAK
jgi:ABC-type phosphate/phosphonate transport system substrate-binding protein